MTDVTTPALRDGSPYAAFDPATDHLEVTAYADGVVLVALTWPERRNAMGLAMTDAWVRLVDVLRADPELRVVVLTGAGTIFSSGGDTSWITSEPDATVGDLRLRMIALLRRLAHRAHARGADHRGAQRGGHRGRGGVRARVRHPLRRPRPRASRVPFTALGMHPGMGTTYLLPEVVGVAAARDLLLTGRTADSEEMLRLGLVSAVSGDDGFLDGVLRAAHTVAATAPLAARLTKVALARGPHADLESARQWEAIAQSVTLTTADLHEGIAASREKRRPRFTGR